ncbi:MAG TPA: hypothetical protein VGX96_18550 [Candidatus Elarobacter sp.]|jgi:hypothetical protein|nr:hypothetical protein [Candidatus Elarobacter sp.]
MQRTRLIAALASAAVLLAAAGAAGVSAQTTMAPTAGPAVGPSTAPATATYAPMATAAPMTKPGGAMAPLPPVGPLALDAKNLRAKRFAGGYTLLGQALVKDACTAARFDQFLGNIFPPLFNVVQYRRPGTQGLLCVQRLTWVLITPRTVTSAAPPRYVSVRTAKGVTRVPVIR